MTAKGQAFARLQLTYLAGNWDLADRLEHAMKVLAMSCGNPNIRL